MIFRDRQAAEEKALTPDLRVVGHEPLRIIQLGPIDPGAAMFRLHSAINSSSPHTSVQATEKVEFIEEPRQYDLHANRDRLRELARLADVVHLHVTGIGLDVLDISSPRWLVMHHHGTVFRDSPEEWNITDRRRDALRLVSNFELLQYADDLEYLPLAVPVERYRRYAESLRPEWERGKLIVAHTPTKTENKGTATLFEAVENLNRRGLEITLKLVNRAPLIRSLQAKAECHVVFDSFWLGLQMSGLEGAAMGVPVIAGDGIVREAYRERFVRGCPWTFANDLSELEERLERLATDFDYYSGEQIEAFDYVRENHDYPAVVSRYLELLDERFGWRSALSL